MSKRAWLIFILLDFFVILCGVSYYLLFSAPGKSITSEQFTIFLDEDQNTTVDRLLERGFIRSKTGFVIALNTKKLIGKIEPGGFKLSNNMNVFEVADILANHPYQTWARIPEGLRKEQTALRIQKVLFWSDAEREQFVDISDEGYLFPDTYLLNLDYKPKDVLKKMQNNFNEKTADLFQEAIDKNIRNDTLVTLASIIQRETAEESDMPLIASVIWNRLNDGMPLQIDATIQYALGTSDAWWGLVTKDNYKLDSPYNTYLHKGKTPTPICSPGLAAISAVLNAPDTEYFFYLHDKDSQIHLSKTYEEHLENVDKYLR